MGDDIVIVIIIGVIKPSYFVYDLFVSYMTLFISCFHSLIKGISISLLNVYYYIMINVLRMVEL